MTSKTIEVVKGVPIDKAMQELIDRIQTMSQKYVVVGVTSDKAPREPKKKPLRNPKKKVSNKTGEERTNNAALAYLHENGSPADRIPPRPFMRQGIAEMRKEIPVILSNGIHKELDGKKGALNQSMHAVGLRAKNSIQGYIRDSSHFVPLSDLTIEKRAADRENSSFHKNKPLYQELRKAGFDRQQAQRMTGFKPLIDTGALLASINYGIRKDGED